MIKSNSGSEEPSTATSSSTLSATFALENASEKLAQVREAVNKIESVNARFNSLSKLKPAPLDIDDLVDLDRAHQHVLWLDAIAKILEKYKSSKGQDLDILVSCHRAMVLIVSELIESSCVNLRSYSLKSLMYIRSSAIPKLEKDLESDLEALNYPKCVLGLEHESLQSHDVAHLKKFQKTYSVLNDLRLPEKVLKQFDLANTDPALVILRPLKKRFKFHFCGTKKTNNPVKPEWYMQQIGNWLKLSRKFFEVVVTPVDPGQSSFERFSSGLCSLVLKKLQKDICDIMYDDVTLSHMIDEILTFSHEFANLDVPEDYLPLVVLLESSICTRWLSLERKFAFAKIDDMMLEEGSWTASNSRSDVSKCIETFVVLLQSITNRFKHLTNSEIQLKFVQLQCDLLEDMRLRLAQILRQEQNYPLNEKFCLILNSSQHLIDVMENWSGIMLYLRLQLVKFGDSYGSQDQSLFKEVLDGFDFLVKDLIQNLGMHIIYEVKARSKLYKDIKWFALQHDYEGDPCPESFPMFQILASQIDFVTKKLSPGLAVQVVTVVREELSEFFILEIVLQTKMSSRGCGQFATDVEKGLFAVLSLSNSSKNLKTNQLREVCRVLTMKQASAILLYESLSDSKLESNDRDILKEVGINVLESDQVKRVLGQRVDLADVVRS